MDKEWNTMTIIIQNICKNCGGTRLEENFKRAFGDFLSGDDHERFVVYHGITIHS